MTPFVISAPFEKAMVFHHVSPAAGLGQEFGVSNQMIAQRVRSVLAGKFISYSSYTHTYDVLWQKNILVLLMARTLVRAFIFLMPRAVNHGIRFPLRIEGVRFGEFYQFEGDGALDSIMKSTISILGMCLFYLSVFAVSELPTEQESNRSVFSGSLGVEDDFGDCIGGRGSCPGGGAPSGVNQVNGGTP